MPRFLLLIGYFSLPTCPALASGFAGAEVMHEHQQNLHCAQDTRGTSLGGHLDALDFKHERNMLDDYNGQADSCTTSSRSSHDPGWYISHHELLSGADSGSSTYRRLYSYQFAFHALVAAEASSKSVLRFLLLSSQCIGAGLTARP
jgi:hypothetical protein